MPQVSEPLAQHGRFLRSRVCQDSRHVGVQIPQLGFLFQMPQTPRTELGGIVSKLLGRAAISAYAGKGLALAPKHVPELLAQAADLDGILDALEARLDLTRQRARLLGLLRQPVQPRRHVGELRGQRRILLRQARDAGELAGCLLANRLGFCLGLFRLILALKVDQLLQLLCARTHPPNAGRGLVPLGLQQFHPLGPTQQLLVQHLDLVAEGIEPGLQRPASSLDRRRPLGGGGR